MSLLWGRSWCPSWDPTYKIDKKNDGGKKHFKDNALKWFFFLDRPGLQSPATWSSEGLVGSREAIRIWYPKGNRLLEFRADYKRSTRQEVFIKKERARSAPKRLLDFRADY